MKPKKKAEYHSTLTRDKRSFYNKLIPLVRESPIIYDRTHRYYKNSKALKKQWEMIGKKVGKTAEDCKKAYKCLRVQFVMYSKDSPSTRKDWIFYDAMRFLEGRLVRYNKGNPPRKPSKPVAADDTTTDDTSMDDVTSNDETTNEESSSEHSEEEKSNEDDLEAVEATSAVKEEIFEVSDESNNFFTISEVQGNVSLPPLANEQLEISAGAPPVLLPNHPTEDIVSSPSSIHHPNHNQVVQEASSSTGTNPDMQHITKLWNQWKPFLEMLVSQLAKVPENRVFEFQVEILKLINDKLNDYNN
uniref:MADF domain-containing protein n=1 Tax=Lutzomyia longipalpis TaxID=7200 RepID=A0A1B0GLL7_LUTLO